MTVKQVYTKQTSEKSASKPMPLAERTFVIERLAGVLICFANIAATAAFLLGFLSFQGKSISVFSAIEMILSVLDLGNSGDLYSAAAVVEMGVLYAVFLIQAVVALPKVFKHLAKILRAGVTRKVFKETMSMAMSGYYANAVRQLILVVVGMLMGSRDFTPLVVTYFLACLAVFLFAYIVRLWRISDGMHEFLTDIASALLYLFALGSALYYAITPAFLVLSQSGEIFENLSGEIGFKGILTIGYTYALEPCTMFVIVCILLHGMRHMFSVTTEEDLYFFLSPKVGKKIVSMSVTMLICRSIIQVYFGAAGSVSTDNAMSVVKHICTANRFDLIPLLLIGVGMLVMALLREKSEAK